MRYLVKQPQGTFPYYSLDEIRDAVARGDLSGEEPMQRVQGDRRWARVSAFLETDGTPGAGDHVSPPERASAAGSPQSAGRRLMIAGVTLAIVGSLGLTILYNVLAGATGRPPGIALGPIVAGGFLCVLGMLQTPSSSRGTPGPGSPARGAVPAAPRPVQPATLPNPVAGSMLRQQPRRIFIRLLLAGLGSLALALIGGMLASAANAPGLGTFLSLPLTVTIFYGAPATILAVLAARKNRNGWAYGLVGGFLPLMGITAMVLSCLPFLCPKCRQPLSNDDWRKRSCPACGDVSGC